MLSTSVPSSDYILVVDDDPDAREILADIVQALGLEVRIAADGEQALEMAFQSPPALVLLDIMMPRLNGLSVVAKLYSSRRTRNVPVILVSANAPNEKLLLTLPNVVGVSPKASFTIDGMMLTIAKTLHLEAHISLLELSTPWSASQQRTTPA